MSLDVSFEVIGPDGQIHEFRTLEQATEWMDKNVTDDYWWQIRPVYGVVKEDL